MNERSVFLVVLEIEEPARRSAYLRKLCGNDEALCRSVEELLAANAAAGSFMDAPAATIGAASLETNSVNRISLDFLVPSDQAGSLGRLGHYQILEVIGSGGFGVVLKAHDEKLHRIVAIKVLAPSLAASAEARQRFVREARAAAAVRHESVIAIFAVEEAETVPYLAMEYVDGDSLEQRFEREGSLALTQVLRIGSQVAAGLAAAHKRGLVHRDVKPSNILVESDTDRVKLTDFGLARAVDDASLSREGMLAGTPEYMSPEQARGQAVDHRTDLFSLGSVLYTLCTGKPPFTADGSLAVLARVANEPPTPIAKINANVPTWLIE